MRVTCRSDTDEGHVRFEPRTTVTQVGDADRELLGKYAAGFAWRLHEIDARSRYA